MPNDLLSEIARKGKETKALAELADSRGEVRKARFLWAAVDLMRGLYQDRKRDMNASDYEWYFAALKTPSAIGSKELPVHEGEAKPGFYRKRRHKTGPFDPVAIWRDETGKLVAMIGDKAADAAELWSWVCRHPVTEEAYRAVIDGERWPDEAPTIGHNSGPADDDEAIADQIEAAEKAVAEFAEIADDERQAQAQSARSRLNELSREADKLRTAEKAPYLEAGKAVDAKWQPLVKKAKAAADAIAKAMSVYETKKAREEAERRRQAEEARRAAEEGARKASEPNSGSAGEAPTVFVPEIDPDPVKTTVKGAYGRAASVKVVKVATVVDQDAAYQAMKTHPELVRLIAHLAQRAVDAGHEIKGVTVEEERKVA